MAAPSSKTIKDLTGKWVMNKSLSSDPGPALALQGISWLVRKAISAATVTLDVRQFEAAPLPPGDPQGAPVTHILIEQSAGSALKGTKETRCLDYEWREHSDWMFGRVRGQSRWIAAADVGDAFLAGGWLEADDEKAGPAGETHVLSHVESLDNGWTATQIWGFQTIQGQRRYARNVIVCRGAERVEMTLVYDWVS